MLAPFFVILLPGVEWTGRQAIYSVNRYNYRLHCCKSMAPQSRRLPQPPENQCRFVGFAFVHNVLNVGSARRSLFVSATSPEVLASRRYRSPAPAPTTEPADCLAAVPIEVRTILLTCAGQRCPAWSDRSPCECEDGAIMSFESSAPGAAAGDCSAADDGFTF